MAAKTTLTHMSPADKNTSLADKDQAASSTKIDGLDRQDGLDSIVGQWQQQGVTDDLIPMAVLGRIARLT